MPTITTTMHTNGHTVASNGSLLLTACGRSSMVFGGRDIRLRQDEASDTARAPPCTPCPGIGDVS